MPKFAIVKRSFAPADFAQYVESIPLEMWKPEMVVLHNTAAPTLAQRPNGFTVGSMDILLEYYANAQQWSGGPHLFVDDTRIWVFNPLDKSGVHSPSWNRKSWGVEMLGDYSTESAITGRGELVVSNTIKAMAAMFKRLGIGCNSVNLRLHKEDPKTNHACPGKGIVKANIIAAVQATMDKSLAGLKDWVDVKIVVYRKNKGHEPFAVLPGKLMKRGVTEVEASRLIEACFSGWQPPVRSGYKEGAWVPVREVVGDHYNVHYDSETHKVYVVEL